MMPQWPNLLSCYFLIHRNNLELYLLIDIFSNICIRINWRHENLSRTFSGPMINGFLLSICTYVYYGENDVFTYEARNSRDWSSMTSIENYLSSHRSFIHILERIVNNNDDVRSLKGERQLIFFYSQSKKTFGLNSMIIINFDW